MRRCASRTACSRLPGDSPALPNSTKQPPPNPQPTQPSQATTTHLQMRPRVKDSRQGLQPHESPRERHPQPPTETTPDESGHLSVFREDARITSAFTRKHAGPKRIWVGGIGSMSTAAIE